jgi:hypothetical protein
MKDLLVDNKTIYNLEHAFITYFSYITKVITFLFIIGFFNKKPSSFIEINFFIKVIIALFLIYRFNKYREKVVFTELDRKVVYSAGMYILTISFIDIIEHYIGFIRSKVTVYTLPVVERVKTYFRIDTSKIENKVKKTDK